MPEQRKFTKGQLAEFEYAGETFVGTVVAWYRDLFTGTELVGVEMDLDGIGVDVSGADSDFGTWGDDGRIDLEASEVTPIS